jgi:biopolymer transport protein ExbD
MRSLVLACTLTCQILAQSQRTENRPAPGRTAPVVSITKDGTVWLNSQRTDASGVTNAIRQRFGAVEVVYVRADKETRWTTIVQVVTALSAATPPMTVNMVTMPEPPTPRK